MHAILPEQSPKCAVCTRLVTFREEVALKEPDWFNGAVASFGDEMAELMVIGLAPGLRGANRTGRIFTGDASGALLYMTLAKFGFTKGTYAEHERDNFCLRNVMVTNTVRCVPPGNKPISAELNTCRAFLKARIAAMPNLKTLLMLGRIAHISTLRALELEARDYPFGHGTSYVVQGPDGPLTLLSSYHCSRYNVNIKRLTQVMFEKVFRAGRLSLRESQA